MKHVKYTLKILAVLLAGWAAFTPAPAGAGSLQADRAEFPGTESAAQTQTLTWQQVNGNGFGDRDAGEVSALVAFNGQLYAGTHNPVDGARIFRSPDGVTWSPVTNPGFDNAHDTRPQAILDLAVFRGRIYACTGRGDGPGQIWRAIDGVTWAPMVIHGFGDPDIKDITSFIEYKSYLYAGASHELKGAQVWRSLTGDNNSWKQVAPAVPAAAGSRVTGMAVYNELLYVAVESDGAPLRIWSSDGANWQTVVGDGFGSRFTTLAGGMAEFGGSLYVGAGNETEGAQLWRTGAAGWQQAIDPGFGDPANQEVETVFVWQNLLYAGVRNAQTGIEFWRSADGDRWEQVNQDGFADKNNTGTNGNHASADFLGDLYTGTVNVLEGGELWRLHIQPADVTGVSLYLPFLHSAP